MRSGLRPASRLAGPPPWPPPDLFGACCSESTPAVPPRSSFRSSPCSRPEWLRAPDRQRGPLGSTRPYRCDTIDAEAACYTAQSIELSRPASQTDRLLRVTAPRPPIAIGPCPGWRQVASSLNQQKLHLMSVTAPRRSHAK